MIRQNYLLFSFFIVFLVQACTSYPQRTVTPYRTKPKSQRVTVSPPQRNSIEHLNVLPQNPVVNKISIQANQLIGNGNLNAAAQTLERGLRIAPKDALLWSQLATVRLKQQRYGQAKSLAAKSSSFAGNNAALVKRNRAIIALAEK